MTVRKVIEGGGRLIKPKGPILDIAYLAIVEDSEGNLVGLWEDR